MEILFAIGVVIYVTTGLFVSRWWWRRDSTPYAPDTQICAFGIVLFWPAACIGFGLGWFVKRFYTRP